MHKQQGHHGHKGHHRNDGHGDPDKGNPMIEGEMMFDKGYVSDDEKSLDIKGDYPGDAMRGNPYFKLNHEIMHRDSTKLKRSKFSKIA